MNTRVVLGQKQTFQLLKYMEEHYTKSGLTDVEFAERATAELGFNITLNRSHIGTARATLGLESNVRPGGNVGSPNYTVVLARLKEIEDLVLAFTVRLDDCVRKVETLQHDVKLKARL